MHDEVSSSDSIPSTVPSTPRKDRPASAKLSVRLPGLPRPEDLFYVQSRKVAKNMAPDIVLECMGSFWELHCPYLTKSRILMELFSSVNKPKSQDNESSDQMLQLTTCMLPSGAGNQQEQQSPRKPIMIKFQVKDPGVSKNALAAALLNLYRSDPVVGVEEAEGLLAAAKVLVFPQLYQKCLSVMLDNINSNTVCRFHHVACEVREDNLMMTCERWLELYLVPHLQSKIQLRELSQDLLLKTLKSPRLFTYSEYQVFRTLLYWLFLRLNPTVQIMPSHSSILTYFISLSKGAAFLERDVGKKYIPLFQCLRLYGIMDSLQLEEIQQIQLLPQMWLVRIFTKHYYALHRGGDMPFLEDFDTQALRFGLIIEGEAQYHTKTISMYGFYFELKAVRKGESSCYNFSMQRLQHSDPTLSFRACKRHPFCLMQERGVIYEIKVQSRVKGKWQIFCTDRVNQEFGVTKKSSESQVLKVNGLSPPIFATFSLAFASF
ncbi:BTBDG protein, partial [Polypterus senegalus]